MPQTNPTDPLLLEKWRLTEMLAGADSVLRSVPAFWKNFHKPLHLEPLADAFARATLDGDCRILSSAPPRFGKSTLICAAIARHLVLRPTDTVMLISYGADLALTKSKLIRDAVVRSGTLLQPDSRAAAHWRTMYGGGVIACGVGGAVTGHGANLIVCDDLYRGRPEAESETIRDSVEQWLRGTALTRLEPGAAVIINSVRWHTDDIHGVLEAEGGWESVNVDCYDDDGESAWPQRWSTHALQLKRKALGDYDFFSQYRGRPRPPGGVVFTGEAAEYEWPELQSARPLIAVDPATSASTKSDYSVIAVGMAYRLPNGLPALDILDVVRMQASAPALLASIKILQQRWQAPVGIEAVGGFKVLLDMARAQGIQRVVPLKANIDKLSRALPAAAAWADGRIRLPEKQEHWKRAFLREVCSFTGVGDKHDDQVDALAHLYAMTAAIGARRSRRPGPRSNIAKGLPFG